MYYARSIGHDITGLVAINLRRNRVFEAMLDYTK